MIIIKYFLNAFAVYCAINGTFYLLIILFHVHAAVHQSHRYFVAACAIGGLYVLFGGECEPASGVECYTSAAEVVGGEFYFEDYSAFFFYKPADCFATVSFATQGGEYGKVLYIHKLFELPIAEQAHRFFSGEEDVHVEHVDALHVSALLFERAIFVCREGGGQ